MRRKMWLAPFAVVLLISICAPLTVEGALTGNVYYFSGSFLEQHIQENTDPTYLSDQTGEFRLTILDVDQAGGDDVIRYNYQGFAWNGAPYPIDMNDTSYFQDNKVYWDLDTNDFDADNITDDADLDLFPSVSAAHPGRSFFVNPSWPTHENDWNEAQEDTEANENVRLASFSFGEGVFSFSFTVDVESDFMQTNGTMEFTFSASYDDDGVLLNYAYTSRMSMQNENYSMNYYTAQTFIRTSGVGGGIASSALTGGLIIAGVAIPVGIVLGLLIGKRMWGM